MSALLFRAGPALLCCSLGAAGVRQVKETQVISNMKLKHLTELHSYFLL